MSVVAIDGPSGSGKSTVAERVATALGWPHLDTGAYYRAATLAVLRAGVDPEDSTRVAVETARHAYDQVEGRMFLDGEDVSEEIRSSRVNEMVSVVAAVPAVRELMVDLQRRWVERRGGRAVVEGRDIGSVVFPEAPVKIHLTADPEVRATRRAEQSGESDRRAVEEDLARRDRLDSTRTSSPLVVAEGAVVVDTTHLSVDQVVETVLGLVDHASRETRSAARDAPSS